MALRFRHIRRLNSSPYTLVYGLPTPAITSPVGPDGQPRDLADMRAYHAPNERQIEDLGQYRDAAFTRRWDDAMQQATQRDSQANPSSLTLGQLVLMKNRPRTRGWWAKRKGPYIITAVLDNYTYKLAAENGHHLRKPVNADQLRPFYRSSEYTEELTR